MNEVLSKLTSVVVEQKNVVAGRAVVVGLEEKKKFGRKGESRAFCRLAKYASALSSVVGRVS